MSKKSKVETSHLSAGVISKWMVLKILKGNYFVLL